MLQPIKDFSWDLPVPVAVEVSSYCVDFGGTSEYSDQGDMKGIWLQAKKGSVDGSYYLLQSPAKSYQQYMITNFSRVNHLIWLREQIIKRLDLYSVDKRMMIVVPYNIEHLLGVLQPVQRPNDPLTLEFIKDHALL